MLHAPCPNQGRESEWRVCFKEALGKHFGV